VPAATILMGDTTIYTPVVGSWPVNPGHYSWHSNRQWDSNVLFFDGHVELLYVRAYGSGTDLYRWHNETW